MLDSWCPQGRSSCGPAQRSGRVQIRRIAGQPPIPPLAVSGHETFFRGMPLRDAFHPSIRCPPRHPLGKKGLTTADGSGLTAVEGSRTGPSMIADFLFPLAFLGMHALGAAGDPALRGGNRGRSPGGGIHRRHRVGEPRRLCALRSRLARAAWAWLFGRWPAPPWRPRAADPHPERRRRWRRTDRRRPQLALLFGLLAVVAATNLVLLLTANPAASMRCSITCRGSATTCRTARSPVRGQQPVPGGAGKGLRILVAGLLSLSASRCARRPAAICRLVGRRPPFLPRRAPFAPGPAAPPLPRALGCC